MIRFLLFPFSFLFGLITFVRNKLYDWKLLPSKFYDNVFVISVGNITVGGTGKTPFVEYLLRLLSQEYRVAVLSHGYKRITKGFRFVDDNCTPAETGDESYLIKQNFPEIVVAVDSNKVNGITQINKFYPDTQIIILDDSFQYRKIKPNLSILLVDYNRPMFRDSMLPGGRLREWLCFAKRADIMVITKTPNDISLAEQKNIEKKYVSVFPNDLFFASIGYGEPVGKSFKDNMDFEKNPTIKKITTEDLKQYDVLLVTGIASPKPFETYIRLYAKSVQTITFPDHFAFSENDFKRFAEKMTDNKILITTEKDAVRFHKKEVPDIVANSTYYIPIEVTFTEDYKKRFDEMIKMKLTT